MSKKPYIGEFEKSVTTLVEIVAERDKLRKDVINLRKDVHLLSKTVDRLTRARGRAVTKASEMRVVLDSVLTASGKVLQVNSKHMRCTGVNLMAHESLSELEKIASDAADALLE